MTIKTTSSQELITLAKARAAADTQHAYTKVPDFEPHEWVWLALRDAYNLGVVNASFAGITAQPVEVVDVSAPRLDQRLDSNWIAGAQFGYMAGETNDHAGFDAAVEARRRDIREANADERGAALAHPRPAGAVALMSVAQNGDPIFQTIDGWKELSPGNLYTAPTGEQAGEVVPYTAEVVAEVVRGDDGQNKLSFVIEGTEAALEVGETLYMIAGLPMPDDGAVEVYVDQPRPMGVPDGWKLVPVDPTRAMRKAGLQHTGAVNATWRDMLAAAPAPGKCGEA